MTRCPKFALVNEAANSGHLLKLSTRSETPHLPKYSP